MSRKMKVIAVATQKGGAGKSTISIHLAVQAMQSKKNAQVILLDLDPQGSVADWAKLRELEDPIVLQAMPGNLSAYLSQAEDDGAEITARASPGVCVYSFHILLCFFAFGRFFPFF